MSNELRLKRLTNVTINKNNFGNNVNFIFLYPLHFFMTCSILFTLLNIEKGCKPRNPFLYLLKINTWCLICTCLSFKIIAFFNTHYTCNKASWELTDFCIERLNRFIISITLCCNTIFSSS